METKKNIFYNLILALSQVLFPLITFPYLARTLGPDHIGAINFSESFARYFIAVAAFGIPIYGVREIAKIQNNIEERSKVFFEIFLINLISTIFLSLIYLLLIFNVNKLTIEFDLFIYSLAFFFLNVFYFEWFFIGLNQFKFIAIRFFCVRLVLILFVFLFVKSSKDYVKYMQIQVLISLLISILNFNFLRKNILLNKIKINNLNLSKHLKPLFLLFLTIFSISIYLNLDTVILGFLSNNKSVGYYSSALKLNKLIISILAAISAAMFPRLVYLYKNGEIEKFKYLITSCFYILLSLSLPLMVLIAGCAKEIIELLFGNNFYGAVFPLQITSPIILFVSMSTIFGFQILSALSMDKSILTSAIIGMTISIFLSYPLIHYFNEIGESIVILVTEIAVCLSFMISSKKFYDIEKYKNIFFLQLLSTLPYVLFILIFKILVSDIIVRLITIGSISLMWFISFHFIILKNSLFKIHLIDLIIEKTQNLKN